MMRIIYIERENTRTRGRRSGGQRWHRRNGRHHGGRALLNATTPLPRGGGGVMLGGGAAAVAGTCAWALPLWLTSPRGPGSSQMRPRRTLFRVVRRLTVLPLPSTMEERSLGKRRKKSTCNSLKL